MNSGAPGSARWAFIFAGFIIAGYGTFVAFLVFVAGEGAWDRGQQLMSGIEAIVFAAVGFVFGREVNRARAELAEVRLQTAEETRVIAERRAHLADERVRKLSAAIEQPGQVLDMVQEAGAVSDSARASFAESALQKARKVAELLP